MTTITTMSIEELMDTPYFSIKRDTQIIKSGGFWCEACLVGKPSGEQSPDSRYCQGCYVYLLKEAEMLEGLRRPSWIPRKPQSKPKKTQQNEKIEASKQSTWNHTHHKQKEVLVHSKSQIPQAYQNPTLDRPKPNVGGRPRKEVPIELVHELSNKGLSIVGIVKELKTQGITLSAMTIQRCLARRTIKGKAYHAT